jgi:hypothetical protein
MPIIFAEAYDSVTSVLRTWAEDLASATGLPVHDTPPSTPVRDTLVHYGHGSPKGLHASAGVWTTRRCLLPPSILVAICCFGAEASKSLGAPGVGFSGRLLVPTGAPQLQGPFGACCNAAGLHVLGGGTVQGGARSMEQAFRTLADQLSRAPGDAEQFGAIAAHASAEAVRYW